VRFEVAQRADAATLEALRNDAEADIRQVVQERTGQLNMDNTAGYLHG